MSESAYKKILAENEKRLSRLNASYDPLTGEGLSSYPGEERVLLHIPDFPIPDQWVPKAVIANPLIFAIKKAGSIREFIDNNVWIEGTPTEEDIITQVRRVRHKHDFIYWCFSCINITAKLGGTVRFKPNYAQLIVIAELEKLRLSGAPLNIVICKARQWGGSTLCLFYQMWILFKWDHYHSFVVAAHVSGASATILNMLSDALKTYPTWDIGQTGEIHLAPAAKQGNGYVIKNDRGEQVFPAVIYVGTAENPDSLRSSNIAGAHYSEVGIWPNTPKMTPQKLLSSISGGITIKRKLTMQVWESTATTSDDYFHDLFIDALDGKSSNKALFIPWFCIPYDTLPVADSMEFVKWLWDNKDMDKPTGKYKSSGKYYWWLWEQGATLEGIQWYRYTELTKTTRVEMLNEAPSSYLEAFQSVGNKVFDFYDVDRMSRGCIAPVYEGELISDGRTGADVLKNIRFLPQAMGKLKIYEMPDDSPIRNRYAVAVDIGGPNPTSDYSVIRVIDRLMMMPDFGLNGKPNIVAEIRYHADHDIVAYDALRLAQFYGHALLIIESNTLETKDRNNGGDGFEFILDICAELYDNLYARHNKEEDIGDTTLRKWGFHTNVSTKPKIIDNMRVCLRDNLWYEPSKICCGEMGEYIEDHGKMTAPPGRHDDVLMATAILLWIAYKEMPIPTWIKKDTALKRKIRSNTNSALL